MKKLKGWTAERKIDKLLNTFKKKKYMPGVRRLIEAKTLIMSLRKENKKLKQELADCIMSNELLDKENDRILNRCSSLYDQLSEYKQFGLDKELERLKNTEGFGKEIKC